MTATALDPPTDVPPRSGNPLLWAVYLGMSWTWCIGMFLPVLLVRDYGPWAWVVFAAPNVVGAAAMGWVLGRPGSSERLIARHRTACVAFSAVTLAFHAFFLTWMADRILPWPACVATVVVATILVFVDRRRSRLDLGLSIGVLIVSAVVLVRFLHTGDFTVPAGRMPEDDLIGVGVVCLLGFALCPYLDLTFHRGRQATSRIGARWAFGLGFGFFFLSMIALTLLYVDDIVNDSEVLRTWLAVHLCVQIGFTWMTHLRTVPRPRGIELPIWAIAAALAVAGGVIVCVPSLEEFKQRGGPSMLTGEMIYRLFMSFYGLVFPAYVWLCMTPLRGRSPALTRRSLVVLMVAILVAAPMFWMGFIVCQTMWLIPGVAVVLIARVFVKTEAA